MRIVRVSWSQRGLGRPDYRSPGTRTIWRRKLRDPNRPADRQPCLLRPHADADFPNGLAPIQLRELSTPRAQSRQARVVKATRGSIAVGGRRKLARTLRACLELCRRIS